ncbi:hypothetical protein ACFFKU_06905 [Kineococcus gynurae]|uniref:Uncharacterized protein n=1 Tax=Kineococcus gynurae TaxID=452979 RepID=A0ABV5LWW5_9ACTN
MQWIAPTALVVGVGLLVAAVAGLAGLWWALAAAGAALVLFAVLDERGRQLAGARADVTGREGRVTGAARSDTGEVAAAEPAAGPARTLPRGWGAA